MQYSKTFEGNPYPTHGIAPICQAMGILRTDRLESLVSMSSLAVGMREYAEEHFGKKSAEAQAHYTGDMNISLLRTAKGKNDNITTRCNQSASLLAYLYAQWH